VPTSRTGTFEVYGSPKKKRLGSAQFEPMPPSQKKKSIKKSQIIHSHHPLTAITIITNKNLTQNNHKNYSKAPPPWGACRCCCGDPAVAVVGKLAAGCGSLLPPRPWRARRRGHGSPPSPLLLDLAEGRRRSPLLPPLPPNLAEGRARPSPPMLPPVAAAAAPSPPAAATRRPPPPLLHRRLPPFTRLPPPPLEERRKRERNERERERRGKQVDMVDG
jgi:hypothetical protein